MEGSRDLHIHSAHVGCDLIGVLMMYDGETMV